MVYSRPDQEYEYDLFVSHAIEEVTELVRYQATAHQAFAAVWERLEPPVRRAWQVAACFAPEERSSDLLDACGVDSQLRRELARFHILEASGPGRWRMHRLLHELGPGIGTEEEQAAAREAFVRGCLEHTEDIDISIGFRIHLPDRSHFDRAVKWRRKSWMPNIPVPLWHRPGFSP